MMHNEIEVHVDDMIVKSKNRGHITNLRKFFERIKEYKLRLNLQKCTFGVTTGKLLGFLVSDRRIDVDPSKIKAILDMPPPKSEKEIRGFLGDYSTLVDSLLNSLPLTNQSSNSCEKMNPIHGTKSVRKPSKPSRNTSSTHLS